MQNLLRNRLVLACLGFAFLLVIFVIGRGFFLRANSEEPYESHEVARAVVIGDFTVPPLPGWSQEIERGKNVRNTTFNQRDRGDQLQIRVGWFVGRTTDAPKTVQELQQEERKYLKDVAPINEIIHSPLKPGPTEPTTFNGMPAVKTDFTQTSGSSYLTHGRYIRFLNGPRYYILTWKIDVAPERASRRPELQAKMDQALKTITDALVPSASKSAS